jgi:hypothetical protein
MLPTYSSDAPFPRPSRGALRPALWWWWWWCVASVTLIACATISAKCELAIAGVEYRVVDNVVEWTVNEFGGGSELFLRSRVPWSLSSEPPVPPLISSPPPSPCVDHAERALHRDDAKRVWTHQVRPSRRPQLRLYFSDSVLLTPAW